MKRRNPADGVLDLFGRNEPRAFELPRCARVTRTPHEILMIELHAHIVPAAVARVIVDDAVRRVEFVGGMREAADHHDRRIHRPCEP